MGPFLGGMPPAVAPEGGLVFCGKPSYPLTFIDLLVFYIYAANWGVGHVIYNKKLGNPR
jgi:hypothetical protein